MHHEIRRQEGIFLRPIAEGLFSAENAPIKHHILLRLCNPDDLGGLQPHVACDGMEAWLRGQWDLFVGAWNEFIPSFSVAGAGAVAAPSGNYMAKTLENAAKWGGRRKTKRQKKRRTLKK
jgi:hypothetical protein